MAVGKVTGYPDYTFEGPNKNIPIIFAGKTLEKLYAATMLSEIASTDYVGEVKNQGDKVIIRTVPSITIKDYVKGQKLDLEYPESPAIEFTVDYAKYFNYALDDIDVKQMDIKMMDKFAADAAQQMKIKIETHVFSVLYNSADAANKGNSAGKISGDIMLGAAGAPLQLTKQNLIDIIVDAGLVLDEQNVPETDRWIVLPSWAIAMIKKSDLKDASLTGDSQSILLNGRIGRIDRFTVYGSNLLATTTDGSDKVYNAMFGHKMAFGFVTQITKVEMYRPQDTFAEAVKGLNVYGFGILQAAALGHLYIKK